LENEFEQFCIWQLGELAHFVILFVVLLMFGNHVQGSVKSAQEALANLN
jgi:hypothetical protein